MSRIILGIDPGIAITGYGLVSIEGKRAVAQDYGVIRTEAGKPLPERLRTLFIGMTQLLGSTRIDECAIEKLFFKKNVTTGMAVSHARGVILLACAQQNLEIAEYGPHQVKQSIGTGGGTDKTGMQQGVRRILGLEDVPKPDDAADALAVALCHWVRSGALKATP